MPTYVYRCSKCKHVFELFHSISDETIKRCPRCRAKAARVPAGGAGILFKASGFYITDYRSKAYREKAKHEKGGAAGSAGAGGSPSSGSSAGGAEGGSAGGGAGSGSRGSSRSGGSTAGSGGD